jgi:VWFA-related protein
LGYAGDQPLIMLKRQPSSWVSTALLLVAITLTAILTAAQQPLPDAPKPQNNAPAPAPPDVTAPVPGMSDDDTSSKTNPPGAENTRPPADQSQAGGPVNPEAPPPGSQGIKTVPAGKATAEPGNDFDELYKLSVNVNFISVPVTVKDHEGKLVDGLLAQDFSVYEDNVKQTITFFTSDAFPLSAAVVIDLGISENTLKKVAATYSALDGSFGPFDKVAVFTYGNSVQKQSDFANPQRLQMALQRIRDLEGLNPGSPVVGGPLGSPPNVNGKPVDPGVLPLPSQAPVRESHVLNDAILMAATELSRLPRENRKIIFVIGNGYEYGSRASYAQVLKVLLTNGIGVYAVGVEAAAIPGMNKIDKLHIPGQGYTDILPKYANATGGEVIDSFSRETIEGAYQSITSQARNQYTLGYTTPMRASSGYRDIEVRVKRPGLLVSARHGYYPLPPQRETPSVVPADATQKPQNPPGNQQ